MRIQGDDYYLPELDGKDERFYDMPEAGPGYVEALIDNAGTLGDSDFRTEKDDDDNVE